MKKSHRQTHALLHREPPIGLFLLFWLTPVIEKSYIHRVSLRFRIGNGNIYGSGNLLSCSLSKEKPQMKFKGTQCQYRIHELYSTFVTERAANRKKDFPDFLIEYYICSVIHRSSHAIRFRILGNVKVIANNPCLFITRRK